MTLEEIRNSEKIHDAIWTYNLCAEVPEDQWPFMTEVLSDLVETLISKKNIITETELKDFFSKTTEKIEFLLNSFPLDSAGIYEYGGLNYLYADIAESFGFPVKHVQLALLDDFVYQKDLQK